MRSYIALLFYNFNSTTSLSGCNCYYIFIQKITLGQEATKRRFRSITSLNSTNSRSFAFCKVSLYCWTPISREAANLNFYSAWFDPTGNRIRCPNPNWCCHCFLPECHNVLVFFSISSCCSSENVAVFHDIHIAACSVAVSLLVIQSELRRFCCLVGDGASRPLSRELRGDPSIVKKMSTVFFFNLIACRGKLFPVPFPDVARFSKLTAESNKIAFSFLWLV